MNTNRITADNWSNGDSAQLYAGHWHDEHGLFAQYERGSSVEVFVLCSVQTGCGLCCHTKSRHHLATVFKRFTCPEFIDECRGPHSFTEDAEFHCRCGGERSEYGDNLVKLANETDRRPAD